MAIGFHEIQFPTDISYGAVFGPEYSTDIVTVSSGYEQRNQNWEHPRYKGDAAHGVKKQAQLDKLIAFFHARRGKVYGFRFKDWSDYKIAEQIIGTGNGSTAQFQLIKSYIDDAGYETKRIIKKPVAGTVNIYADGVLQSNGWAVDTTTGIVTAALTGVITADCEFDVPVRFDNDYMPISIDNFNLYSWDNIPIVEIRVRG